MGLATTENQHPEVVLPGEQAEPRKTLEKRERGSNMALHAAELVTVATTRPFENVHSKGLLFKPVRLFSMSKISRNQNQVM